MEHDATAKNIQSRSRQKRQKDKKGQNVGRRKEKDTAERDLKVAQSIPVVEIHCWCQDGLKFNILIFTGLQHVS